MSVLAKVQSAELDRRQREGELLDRRHLFQVGSAICQVLVEKLADLPNYDAIVDALLPAIEHAIVTVSHGENREPLRLTHDESAGGHHALRD